MNKQQIPDFTDTEMWAIRTAVSERFRKSVDLELADAELRLDPASATLTTCPTVYWAERGANFVIAKTASQRYRCQFFYRGNEQFGTGREEYDDLAECVVTLLQVQADHEASRA